ncbi:hypothetical protein SADUNF_Sadunf17G0111300 [Salix dunnii]|uniref:Uncharacterized protein n=1 Tax=Salix dunnii TaxID=1413687 RepID=A0A835J7S4_9ROSI|nr:hypothetical protein SADUNF_Sadunf17G0111300 [Salix dunnii]
MASRNPRRIVAPSPQGYLSFLSRESVCVDTMNCDLSYSQHKVDHIKEKEENPQLPSPFSQKQKMERAPRSFYGSWKRYWRRKRYQRLDGVITAGKKITVARLGGIPRRGWKVKAVPKLRILKSNIVSPLKLLSKLRNAYINMMLGLAGEVDGTNVFGNKRVPRGRQVKATYPSEEFEKRLVYEIYKNLLATRELSAV